MRRLAVALAILVSGPLRAERLPIQRRGVADGLAEETVTALLRDSRGFLWVGSLNGLSRFDGERFRVYGLEDGLPRLRVNALADGADGAIWVATNGGLARLDPSAATTPPAFVGVPVGPAPGRSVDQLHRDRDGTLWAGSGGELFRIARDGKGAYEAVATGFAGPSRGALVRGIVEGPDGELFIGSSRGLFRRRPSGPFEGIALPGARPDEEVRGLFLDRASRLWVSTARRLLVLRPGAPLASPALPFLADGRVTMPREAGEVRELAEVPGLPPGFFQRTLETSDGRVFVSTTAGLIRIDGAGLTVFTRRNGLGDGLLRDLLEDVDGSLWIGTQSTGLLRLPRGGFTGFDERDGLEDPRVNAFLSDPDGNLIAASGANSLLQRFDGRVFQPLRWKGRAALPTRWSWGHVTLRDRRGEWWLATSDGLLRYPAAPFGPALAGSSPKARYTTAEGLGADDVSTLYEDAAGTIWAGAFDADAPLARFDPASGRFHALSAEEGLRHGTAQTLLEDRNGALWVALGLAGVYRGRDGRFEKQDVPDGAAYDLRLDHEGRLWVANGGGGLVRIDEPLAERPHGVVVKTSEGPAVASALCLTEDATGLLYVGTTRGVVRLDPRSGQVRRFTTADGLVNNLTTAAFRDRSGALWFGSFEGVSRLVPVPETARPLPAARITGLRVNGTPRPVPELGGIELSGFDLAPDENRIRIDFVAPGLSSGEPVRYQTRLQGLDGSWSAPLADTVYRFLGLPSGRYRFSVRTVGSAGDPPGPEAHVSFRIEPPFWRRWWFLAGAALSAAAAAFAVNRQSVRRAVEVERVRTRIATDLHDDVGSSLARISILSEVAAREVAPGGEAGRLLADIGETSREVSDALGDSIWSIDPRRDDLQSVGDRIRRFAADLLDGRGIALSIDFPADASAIDLPAEPRRHLFLLLKEAVTNAARHSRAAHVSIAIRRGPAGLDVEVRDDGVGMDVDAARPGRGLASLAERARALGGRLEVVSRPGEGASIRATGLTVGR